MKVNEIGSLNLNETIFKMSANSITVKDINTNKTKAVINDIQAVSNLPFKKKVDLNIQFKSKLNKYTNDHLYITLDGKLFYFIDQKHHQSITIDFNNGWKDELEKLQSKIVELTLLGANIIFLNIN